MKRLSGILLLVLLGALASAAYARDGEAKEESEYPLWAQTPDTISSQWRKFFINKGLGRKRALPAPDDLEGWAGLQAANDRVKEGRADGVALALGVSYREFELGGIPVVEVTPAKLLREDKVVVYLHGGAYVLNSAKAVIASAGVFAAETGLRVLAVDYTLAPHSRWQQTTDEVVSVFEALAEQGVKPGDVLLYGDSAGGGLAAAITLKMRDRGLAMPAALVLWSPWTDVTGTGDSYISLRDAEPFYTYEHILGPAALAYADASDHKNPYVSPVYGDFSKGFPPTLIQGGTRELLLSDFVRLYQALDRAGQTVKLDLYEGMPHVFIPTMPNSMESRYAMAKVLAWAERYLLAGETPDPQ